MVGSEITHEAIGARFEELEAENERLQARHVAQRVSLQEHCGQLGHIFGGRKWLRLEEGSFCSPGFRTSKVLDGYSQHCTVCDFEQWFDNPTPREQGRKLGAALAKAIAGGSNRP